LGHMRRHKRVHTGDKDVGCWTVGHRTDSREEGTRKPIPPQETEKFWHESSDPQ
jgi:hypothetical protein